MQGSAASLAAACFLRDDLPSLRISMLVDFAKHSEPIFGRASERFADRGPRAGRERQQTNSI